MFWFYCLVVALGSREQGAAEATDWMKPSNWTGNFWGPVANRARSTGQLPPLPSNAAMTRWRNWGRNVLRDGDIVFRLGDARALRGLFPRPDDAALYCVELTEKAFRSQGLMLSQPVRIGDWEYLGSYPLTALATPYVTGLMLEHPISLEQPVYVPGNERQGVWGCSLLETVFGPEPKLEQQAAHSLDSGLSLRGDLELALFVTGALHRCYADLQNPNDIRIGRAVPADNRRPETSPIAIDD
jgi:hypothetical protein